MVRTLAMPGALVVIGIAGAAAYVVTRQPVQPPPPASAAAPASVAAQAAPEAPPAPAFVAGGTPGQQATPLLPQAAPAAAKALPPSPAQTAGIPATPPTTVFTPQTQAYTLVHDSAAYVAATPDAPQMYPLKAGTAISTVARSADNLWVIALTETGQAAFLPTADLGPYDPRLAPGQDLQQTISGVAQVVDTGNLVVNGQPVQLAGVKGEGGVYAAQLQSMINSQGAQVQCSLQGAGYVCMLGNGLDIARTALWNGGADVASDASDDYRAQAAAARAARKGIWH
jgi:endonuclease YncB( thermonuclease family)